MWVKFKRDWDWRERPTALVEYKEGMVKKLTKAAYDAAKADDVIEDHPTPKKSEVDQFADKPARPGYSRTKHAPTEADLGEPEAPGGGDPAGGSSTPA